MSTPPSSPLFLSYYGDDFTGSTDVMEVLTRGGVPTALFLEPPDAETVHSFRSIEPGRESRRLSAFGVAGVGRTMSPASMRAELPEIFRRIAAVPTRFFHYKICSTFDSAPEVGNIGVATDLALASFPSRLVPLLVGAPALGRFCVFGNLFARAGGEIFRLDRHPTMARHPVTPMDESDLRQHLARLTPRPVELLDLMSLRGDGEECRKQLEEAAGKKEPFMLFDVLADEDLERVGELLLDLAPEGRSAQLVVGSSAVEDALCGALRRRNKLTGSISFRDAGERSDTVVMAGSAAPATAAQIEHALGLGFADLRLDPVALADPDRREAETARAVEAAGRALRAGKPPLLYLTRGPDDEILRATRREVSPEMLRGSSLGTVLAQAQGVVLRRTVLRHRPQRVVVAGGDTSGFAARALGIRALEMVCPIAPGAPLCRAHAEEAPFHGLEIALKGGQNGNERYFESIRRGHAC